MISETKLDETFSETQFFIDAFTSPYTMDRNAKFKWYSTYVREDIPCRKIPFKNHDKYIEHLFTLVQMNL